MAVQASKQRKNVLVICPKHIKLWWEEEIRRWAGREDVRQCLDRPALLPYQTGWLIAHWEQIRMYIKEFQRIPFDWIIADEAHRVKNRGTQTFKAFKKLRAPNMVLVTGTPMQNHPGELWSLLHILDPRRYPSYWTFFDMYVKSWQTPWGPKPVGVRNEDLLAKELAPVMLRRRKEVYMQLPPKRYQTIHVELAPEQAKAYKEMATLFWTELANGVEWTAPNAIAKVVRLQQIAISLRLLNGPDIGTKIDTALDLIADSNDESIVVFSKFRKSVLILQEKLRALGISCEALLGGLGPVVVADVVKRFQAGEFKVLACTLATGGIGLTLTKAHTALFLDRHWVPATQQQAEDRIHRIGQDHPVLIQYLHVLHSVDDLVERVCNRKEAMTQKVWMEMLRQDLGYWKGA